MLSLIAHSSWRGVFAGLIALLLFTSPAVAQTWSGGGGSALWSDVGNWVSSTPPANGGSATFNASSVANLGTFNDLVASLSGITIGALPGTAGTTPVSISSNALSLGSGGITMTAATQDLTVGLGANNLSLSASQTWGINGRTLTVNAASISLSTTTGNTLTLAPTSTGTMVLNGNIVDGAAVSAVSITPTVGTAATLRFLGTNTYTGGTTITARTEIVQIGSGSAFGTGPITFAPAPSGTSVVTQIQAFGGAQSIGNNIIENFGFNFSGSNNLTLNGSITASQGRAIAYNGAAGTLLTFNGPYTIGTAGAAAGTLTTGVVSGTTTASSTLVFNGVLSEAVGVTSGLIVSLVNGNGVGVASDQFNNQNTYSGGTTLTGQGATAIIGSSSVLSGSTIISGPLGTGAVTVANATTFPRLVAANGAQSVANNFTLTSGLAVQGTNDLTLAGVLSGAGGINKTGNSGMNLTNANSYSGATNVTGGRLSANNSTGSATGTSVVSVTGTGSVGSGGTLGGTGTISGAITISSATAGSQGGTVAPGNSVGTLNIGSMTWNPNGQYNFEHSATDTTTGGTTNDLISGSGTLNIAGLASGAFNINLLPTNFAPTPAQQTYTIATFAGGITGSGGPFPTGTNDVSNLFTLSGTFTSNSAAFAAVVGTTGGPQSLQITFTPVPEPAFVLAACGGLTALAAWRRKRRLA